MNWKQGYKSSNKLSTKGETNVFRDLEKRLRRLESHSGGDNALLTFPNGSTATLQTRDALGLFLAATHRESCRLQGVDVPENPHSASLALLEHAERIEGPPFLETIFSVLHNLTSPPSTIEKG